jgi:hypothetical protein
MLQIIDGLQPTQGILSEYGGMFGRPNNALLIAATSGTAIFLTSRSFGLTTKIPRPPEPN